jgi:ABC-type lipoprotein export system ATPase subunit
MIKIKDLEKIYRTDEVETVALNKLSIDVKEGEFVAIMGPSGCGKSTLLKEVSFLMELKWPISMSANVRICGNTILDSFSRVLI